ncbi:hypothetical protein HK100_002923 [Physocladia obscura]|uniref:Uncharacterized protein n=1 Tax=Physocladia obscura TaxID=109957 RepID=A0AAD5T0N0_9FUNG|nr:hypothetical protein HK100_002923 [Physocladia obscura]
MQTSLVIVIILAFVVFADSASPSLISEVAGLTLPEIGQAIESMKSMASSSDPCVGNCLGLIPSPINETSPDALETVCTNAAIPISEKKCLSFDAGIELEQEPKEANLRSMDDSEVPYSSISRSILRKNINGTPKMGHISSITRQKQLEEKATKFDNVVVIVDTTESSTRRKIPMKRRFSMMPPIMWDRNRGKNKSESTIASSTSPNGSREIPETVGLGLLQKTENGVLLSIPSVYLNEFGGITLFVVLLICNMITMWSLDEAASCIFGYMLSRNGFSFAVTGFMHAPPLRKVLFSQSLALTSQYRKIFFRISFLWILVEGLKILTPISAVALEASKWAIYNDYIDCIYFSQERKPVDRKWPNLNAESGVGEYVFGSSLGIMRSENSVNLTTAMHPPALISALNDGDTIKGPGFSVDISTTCKCSSDVSAAAFVGAGVVFSQAQEVLQQYISLQKRTGLTFGVTLNNESVQITNVFTTRFGLCGGSGPKSSPLVCSTIMDNHLSMILEIAFMTDGTTASIAPNVVNPISITGQASLDWLAFAMNAILNGPVSSYLTNPTVPGSLSPLLWWTSPNLIAVDRGIVEAGVETMYAILFKAAIQRTYISNAMSCPRKNTLNSFQSLLMIMPSGYFACNFILVVQIVISIAAILCFGFWFSSPSPISPAVRALQEPIYLIALLATSTNIGTGLNDYCNAETYAIWQKLDTKCKIGESITTIDLDTGKIVLEKPSLHNPETKNKKSF